MKIKIFTFFVLVFGFCAFADDVSFCLEQKQKALSYVIAAQSANDVVGRNATQIIGATSDQTVIGLALAQYNAVGVSNDYLDKITSAIGSISCNASNDTCSVDLGPLVAICSNIYDVVSIHSEILGLVSTNISYFAEYFTEGNVHSVIHIGNDDIASIRVSNYEFEQLFSSSFEILTNQVDNLYSLLGGSVWGDYDYTTLYEILLNIDSNLFEQYQNIRLIQNSISRYLSYLSYLEIISNDLKLIITNGTFQADYDFTNQLFSSSLLGFDRFRYYAQGQSNNNQLQLYPLSPYDTASNLRNATIYDALSSGFASLLISQGSINNYLYWLKAIAGSNRLEAVEAHLVAVSNLVGRLDDYVLGDFSNEVSRLVETLSYVTNRVDYTTNLVEIASLLQTSTNHLASIDSKLDVLDYIKILSDTPLADYGGDVDYFDYLTNLYLSGVSSSGVSTNWFERMEILLASLVFGDSDGTNGIPQSVEMQGFDSDTVEGAMSDFSFSEDFSTSVDNLSETSRNFMQVLNDYHSAIKNVSLPASVSIGLFGMDTGGDTTNYEQLLDHSFQVSFDVGAADRFTVVVRAVTTMSWVLLTMIFIWHCGFWILQKIQFFYRLMRLLINSIWLKS